MSFLLVLVITIGAGDNKIRDPKWPHFRYPWKET